MPFPDLFQQCFTTLEYLMFHIKTINSIKSVLLNAITDSRIFGIL